MQPVNLLLTKKTISSRLIFSTNQCKTVDNLYNFNCDSENANLVNLKEHPQSISAQNVLSEIEQEFIGLSSVKQRLREICAQLVIYQLTGQAKLRITYVLYRSSRYG
jgi:hypothetical protein